MTGVSPTPVQPPAPRASGGLRPGGLIGIIAGSGGLIIVVALIVFAVILPPSLTLPATAAGGPAAGGSSELVTVNDLYGALNTALRAKDRDAFMSHVTGDAVAPLTLWWDNMDKIGWTTGAISAEGASLIADPKRDGSVTVSTIFGASMGFSASSPRGSGTTDAGKSFVEGVAYDVTVGYDKGVVITKWKSAYTPSPWETDTLHVAHGAHVVVAGRESESAFVDSMVAPAEQAAEWVLAQYAAAGQTVPLDGFTAFVTDDEGTFDKWFTNDTTKTWKMDVAGYAQPTLRPLGGTQGLDPLLALGGDTSTSVVSIGPGAATNPADVLVHEFVHVVHYTQVSGGFGDPPLATIEGWARYQDARFASGKDTFPASDPQITACLKDVSAEGAAPTDDQLHGGDANCYYELAATRYAYAASKGYDVYTLSDLAKRSGDDIIAVSGDLHKQPALSNAGWAAWVKSQY